MTDYFPNSQTVIAEYYFNLKSRLKDELRENGDGEPRKRYSIFQVSAPAHKTHKTLDVLTEFELWLHISSTPLTKKTETSLSQP